jgi:hypothetical protein
MYCPECGNDVADANFCAECGADLKTGAPPSCPSCGAELPDGAKFCTECGAANGKQAKAAAAAAPAAATVRRTGKRGRSGSGGPRPEQRQRPPKSTAQPPQKAAAGPRRISPAVIWGGFAAAAAVIIVVVILISNGGGSPDTSGGYSALVQRANGIYDQGSKAFDAKNYAKGAAYFEAAAKVYAAAWKQQSTDPGVGTDYATSLFYAGQIDPALAQIDRVLAKSPTFQTAWFNKGNYLSEKARQAGKAGNAKDAKATYTQARAAYEKAIALGATTATGAQAQQRLDALPK